jgi:hypothetical protein
MMSDSEEDRTKTILDRYLDQDFACFACGEQAPTPQDLELLTRKLETRFPAEFVEHSTSKFGGLYIEVKEEIWPRPKEFEVGPFWSFLYGLFVYSASPEAPEWMSLETAAARFREETGHRPVPFLKIIGDADLYCFDENGAIVRWNHETDEFEPVDKTFFQLLEEEIASLEERKERKKSQ